MSSPRKTKLQSEDLIVPKLPRMMLLIPIMILPIVFAVLCGIMSDQTTGRDDDIWEILLLVFLLLEVAGLITFLVLGISTKIKLKKASKRVADLLQSEYGVSIPQSTVLVTQNSLGKTFLNKGAINALDSAFQPLLISIRTDETGTKVVPTLHV